MQGRPALDICLDALEPGSLVLVAVSGGADSVHLLRLLAEALPPRGHRLAGVHVHHGQRGADAGADAAFVEELCRRMGLDVYTERLSLPPGAGEDDLRRERLSALKARAARAGASAVAFGHTEDDTAETFLLMALRGSGPRGLGSMGPVRETPEGILFLRPLLGHSRAEIREALRAAGQPWREDASNDDQRFRRNVLRREVLPALGRLEPAAAPLLARSAAHCRAEDEVVARLADQMAMESLRWEGNGTLLFDTSRFEGMAEEPAAELIRSMVRLYARMTAAGGEKPFVPTRSMLVSLAQQVSTPPKEPVWFTLTQGVYIWIWRGTVLFSHVGTTMEEALLRCRDAMGFMVHLGSEGPVPPDDSVPAGGGRLYSRRIPGPAGKLVSYLIRPRDRAEWFDPAVLGPEPPVLRRAAAEDRVVLARGGRKPVFDLLRERGVAAPLRPYAGLLEAGGRIIWIPGIWRAPVGYIDRETPELLHLAWIPPQPPEDLLPPPRRPT